MNYFFKPLKQSLLSTVKMSFVVYSELFKNIS